MILVRQRKQERAQRRKKRVRGKIEGRPECPRVSINKSLRQIYVQLVDDLNRRTITGLSSLSESIGTQISNATRKTDIARLVGIELAKIAKSRGIQKIVFDRNRYRYHGRVKALAEGMRAGGLQF